MSKTNYNNCKNSVSTLCSSEIHYDPSIPCFSQMCAPHPQYIERKLFFDNVYLQF